VTRSSGPIFTVKLRPIRFNDSGIHGLRAILKQLLRRYGFRCISAHEEQPNSRIERE
jgi:hypothetical protein